MGTYGSKWERCFDEEVQQVGVIPQAKLGRRHVRANTDARGVYSLFRKGGQSLQVRRFE